MITLLYHEISDKPHWLIERFGITIKPKVFEMHMKIVKEYDAQITFDDGFKSAVQYAGDILLKYKLKSIWHVNSRFWDNDRVFWLSKLIFLYPGLLPEVGHLCYSKGLELFLDGHFPDERTIAQKANLYASPKELKSLNAEIGNHTVSHLNVRNITLRDFHNEIAHCHHQIKGKLGIIPNSFAFPFGEYPFHWDLAGVEVLRWFNYGQIFGIGSEEIHGVLPRYIVPVDLDSETGFKEWLECIEQG